MKDYLSKILLITIFFLVISCGEWSFDEVARESSPNEKVDAVLVETNGGATTSFGYRIFIVPKDEKIEEDIEESKVATLYGAVRNESAYGVNLKWYSENELVIEYLRAKNEQILKPKITIETVDISVKLKNGIKDYKAPAGGMLYNLEKLTNNSSK